MGNPRILLINPPGRTNNSDMLAYLLADLGYEVIEAPDPDDYRAIDIDGPVDMVIAPMYYFKDNNDRDYDRAATYFKEAREQWGDNLLICGLTTSGISEESYKNHEYPAGIEIIDTMFTPTVKIVDIVTRKLDEHEIAIESLRAIEEEKILRAAVAGGEKTVRALLQQGISSGGLDKLCTLVENKPSLKPMVDATREIFRKLRNSNYTDDTTGMNGFMAKAVLDACIDGKTISEFATDLMAAASDKKIEDYESAGRWLNFKKAVEERLKGRSGPE